MTTFVAGQVLTAAELNAAFGPLTSFFPENYGAISGTVSGAQRIANVTSINNCHAAATAAGGQMVMSGVTYQVDGTLQWLCAADDHIAPVYGVRLITRIEQYNSAGGIDTIQYGTTPGNPLGRTCYGGIVDGIKIVSITDQTSITPTGSNLGAQLALGNLFFCTLRHIIIGENTFGIASTTHYAYNGIVCDPAVNQFSCNFHDIEIKGYGNRGWDMAGTSSGDVVSNVMIRNGGDGDGPLKSSTGPALRLHGRAGVFSQINIEWSDFVGFNNYPIQIEQPGGTEFHHLHIEGLQIDIPFAAGVIACTGQGTCTFTATSINSLTVPNTSTTTSLGLFIFGGFAPYMYVGLGELIIQSSSIKAGVGFTLVVATTGSNNCQVDFNGPLWPFYDGTFSSGFTGWSSGSFNSTNQGPRNGLGVPPSNFIGRGILDVQTTSPGYSAGVFTPVVIDGYDAYNMVAAANGTVVLPQTKLDTVLPITIPPYPGIERTVINPAGSGHTWAVHNEDGTNCLTAANLAAGQYARFRFDDSTSPGKWRQISAGTLL